MKIFSRLATSKTAWTVVGSLAGVGTAYANGQMSGKEATAAAVAGLITLFMRDGMAQIQEKLDSQNR